MLGSLLLIGAGRPSPARLYGLILLLGTWTIVFASASWDYRGYLSYVQCATSAVCYAPTYDAIEPSFQVVAQGIFAIFGNQADILVLAAYTLPAVAIKLYLLGRHSPAFGYSLAAYAVFGFFVHEMTQIRVGLAIAFLWAAMCEWGQQRRLSSLLLFVVANIFHSSAIIAAVVPLASRLRPPPIVLLALLLLLLAIGPQLAENFGNYETMKQLGLEGRLGAYLTDIENDISLTPQISAVSIGVLGIAILGMFGTRTKDFTRIEALAFTSLVLGVGLYLASYWIPVVSARLFELLSSTLPFVVASIGRHSRFLSVRIAVVAILVGIGFNLLVRNGTRRDFVLEHQAQYVRLLEGRTN